MIDEEIASKYPATPDFRIVRVVGVPHPYCIGSKHVAHAADHFCGRLGEDAIEAAEKHGAKCCICHGTLSYREHKRALVVEVNDQGRDLHDVPGTVEYLKSIADQAEKDGFVGFTFVRKSERTT